MPSFLCLYCQLWADFTNSPTASIVDFEQVNITWEYNTNGKTQNKPALGKEKIKFSSDHFLSQQKTIFKLFTINLILF